MPAASNIWSYKIKNSTGKLKKKLHMYLVYVNTFRALHRRRKDTIKTIFLDIEDPQKGIYK